MPCRHHACVSGRALIARSKPDADSNLVEMLSWPGDMLPAPPGQRRSQASGRIADRVGRRSAASDPAEHGLGDQDDDDDSKNVVGNDQGDIVAGNDGDHRHFRLAARQEGQQHVQGVQ